MSGTTRGSEPIVTFGAFSIDRRSLELRRDGRLLRLQQQPARVLLFLVERAGDLVTREELQREIWGDDVVVDFDRGLNFCISQIRSVFAEGADGLYQIETLRGRGYRFVGSACPAPCPAPVATAHLPSDPVDHSRRWWTALLIGTAAFVTLGGVSLTPPQPSALVSGVIPLSSNASGQARSSNPGIAAMGSRRARSLPEDRADPRDALYRVTVTRQEENGSIRWSDSFQGRPGDWIEAQQEMSRIIPQVVRHYEEDRLAGHEETHIARISRPGQQDGPSLAGALSSTGYPSPTDTTAQLSPLVGYSSSIFGFLDAFEFWMDGKETIVY